MDEAQVNVTNNFVTQNTIQDNQERMSVLDRRSLPIDPQFAPANQYRNAAHRALVVRHQSTRANLVLVEAEFEAHDEQLRELRVIRDRFMSDLADLTEAISDLSFDPPHGYDIFGDRVTEQEES